MSADALPFDPGVRNQLDHSQLHHAVLGPRIVLQDEAPIRGNGGLPIPPRGDSVRGGNRLVHPGHRRVDPQLMMNGRHVERAR